MTGAVVAVAAVVGLLAGGAANRAAGAFPWQGTDGPRARSAVRPPVLELATAGLFAGIALRLGTVWELPAFLAVAGAGVLLTLIDVRHRLLPNRVIAPAAAATLALLVLAAAAGGAWDLLLRACLGAVVLFAVYLVMALISPRSLGMGDVKLAGLIGLPLGWLGWGAVLVGAAAGFVVQAALALALLAARRIGLGAELPFGPAMLLGAAIAVAWGGGGAA